MHLAEIDNWTQEKLASTTKLMFDELKVKPVMHELVYEKELKTGASVSSTMDPFLFFDRGIITQKEIKDIADSASKKKYYETVFKEIYRDFKGDLPDCIRNIFTDWVAHASLGETHTVVMCFVVGCDIFLSDDGDAKALAKIIHKKKAFDIEVHNREGVLEKIKAMGSTAINKSDRRVLKHKPK